MEAKIDFPFDLNSLFNPFLSEIRLKMIKINRAYLCIQAWKLEISWDVMDNSGL